MARQILHIDMDAFYASVEQRDNPDLRGKPVLVGGSPDGRGVVSAASYEARPFGCRSAMPTGQALRLCPDAILLPVRMERYIEVSRQVFDIFEQFTPLVQPLSIDEAFLDVTGSTRLFGTPERMAADIKGRIRDETGLTASVGVAPNMFLAKLASDLDKPDGLVVVPADDVQGFLDPLPIGRLWGAGAVTQRHFERLGVKTFGDVRRLARADLRREFGEAGDHFHELVRGHDERAVETNGAAKSVSHEVTFARDVDDLDYVRAVLLGLMESVAGRLRRHEYRARTVVLKLRDPAFVTISRRTTLNKPTDCTDELWQAAAELFERWRTSEPAPVRLAGVGVTNLAESGGEQLELFEDPDRIKMQRLDDAVDRIREQYGDDAIRRGGQTES